MIWVVNKKVGSIKADLFYNCRMVKSDFKGHDNNMAFLVSNGCIQWIGQKTKLPRKYLIQKETDLKKKLVMPSFIECHTHTVFAGDRADEFELRNNGTSYLEIARQGGGILSTVENTRQISISNLKIVSQERVNQFLRQGVSTLEIKSGYGLDLKTELKMLQVAQLLKGPQIITTFLGAHAKPTEFKSYVDYLQFITEKVLPQLKKKKLTNRVDIFIEKNFFETKDAKVFLNQAQREGFDLTIHANQLTQSGAADLALELGARSADHVIHLSDQTIQNFSKTKTVAVLLPTADLYMKCPYPNARGLLDAGATVALATDFNPGSCPSQDLMLVGLLARLEMKMTLPEVFTAYTKNAARALGIDHEQGDLSIGKYANFICTEAQMTDFFYSPGQVPKHELFIRGKQVKV
jgi:imidazolonepropionase